MKREPDESKETTNVFVVFKIRRLLTFVGHLLKIIIRQSESSKPCVLILNSSFV